MSNQEILHVYTLGQLRLERREESEWLTVTDAVWQHQRVRLLLRCLVSLPNRCIDRKVLLDQMWSGLESENAGGRLDRAVHDLRRVIEPERLKPATSPFLLTKRETITLADQQHIWIDADAFEQAIAQARESDDLAEKEQLLTEAAKLYRGDFLPEEQECKSTLRRRASVRRSFMHLLSDLAEVRLQHGTLIDVIDPLELLLSLDASNEAVAQQLMRVLEQLGRRGEALRVYKRLSTTLQHEHQAIPTPMTTALYETIHTGRTALSEVPRVTSLNQTLPVHLDHTHQRCDQVHQGYEFIDVMRGLDPHSIYMTLFDDDALRFFLLAVLHDTLHFPIGSAFRFQAFHPDAPGANPLLPETPVGTASFLKQEYSIEIVTTTGILTELLVTKFGFTNSPEAPALWKLTEKDV